MGLLKAKLAAMPDRRTGTNTRYSMTDIGMGAFSLFFMQCPSFLEHQRRLDEGTGTSNARTLFGIDNIPTPNHIRKMLDGVPPEHFDDLFIRIARDLDRRGAMRRMRVLGDRTPVALDGSEYFTSRRIGCPNCSTRKRADGGVENFHAFLGATVVAPGHNLALPLPPEIITPQDGHGKQDCERAAAKRWLGRIGPRVKGLRPVYLGDDLLACQPVCDAVFRAGGNFIMVCKPSSHKILYEHVRLSDERHEVNRTVGRGRERRRHHCAWVEDVPLRGGPGAMRVTWVGCEVTDPAGKGRPFRSAFVTDLKVTRHNVLDVVACGRARWKIENSGFNVLKNIGYHLEHSFGHGKLTLACVLLVLNLIAFAMHTACDLGEELWMRCRDKWGARKRMFDALRSVTTLYIYGDWSALVGDITPSPHPRPPPRAPP